MVCSSVRIALVAGDNNSHKADEAKQELVRRQAQLDNVGKRMIEYRNMFRDERDEAVREALKKGVTKREVTEILDVTPQWLNKLLRGQAYRRSTD